MSSKRRKILTADSSHKGGSDSGIIRLSDLPVEPLTHVASYLAPPSRALFDVALNFDAKLVAAARPLPVMIGTLLISETLRKIWRLSLLMMILVECSCVSTPSIILRN